MSLVWSTRNREVDNVRPRKAVRRSRLTAFICELGERVAQRRLLIGGGQRIRVKDQRQSEWGNLMVRA